jgi:hypothetical protein
MGNRTKKTSKGIDGLFFCSILLIPSPHQTITPYKQNGPFEDHFVLAVRKPNYCVNVNEFRNAV